MKNKKSSNFIEQNSSQSVYFLTITQYIGMNILNIMYIISLFTLALQKS